MQSTEYQYRYQPNVQNVFEYGSRRMQIDHGQKKQIRQYVRLAVFSLVRFCADSNEMLSLLLFSHFALFVRFSVFRSAPYVLVSSILCCLFFFFFMIFIELLLCIRIFLLVFCSFQLLRFFPLYLFTGRFSFSRYILMMSSHRNSHILMLSLCMPFVYRKRANKLNEKKKKRRKKIARTATNEECLVSWQPQNNCQND